MRNDMLDVVYEPARRGVAYYRTLPNEYRKAKHFKFIDVALDGDEEQFTVDVDDVFCARVLPMRAKQIGWDGKEGSMNLSAFKRYLRSCVGRKWNDVYSEICKYDKGDRRYNLRNKIDWKVELHTYVGDDDKIYYRGYGGDRCVEDGANDLYVDPRDGTLQLSRGESYRQACIRRTKEEKAKKEKIRHIINKKLQFHKIDGNWYRVYTEPRTDLSTVDILGNFGFREEAWRLNNFFFNRYGDQKLCGVRKEAASKADIRNHKLS